MTPSLLLGLALEKRGKCYPTLLVGKLRNRNSGDNYVETGALVSGQQNHLLMLLNKAAHLKKC